MAALPSTPQAGFGLPLNGGGREFGPPPLKAVAPARGVGRGVHSAWREGEAPSVGGAALPFALQKPAQKKRRKKGGDEAVQRHGEAGEGTGYIVHLKGARRADTM